MSLGMHVQSKYIANQVVQLILACGRRRHCEGCACD